MDINLLYLYQVYARYIPYIYLILVYTWYIPGIYQVKTSIWIPDGVLAFHDFKESRLGEPDSETNDAVTRPARRPGGLGAWAGAPAALLRGPAYGPVTLRLGRPPRDRDPASDRAVPVKVAGHWHCRTATQPGLSTVPVTQPGSHGHGAVGLRIASLSGHRPGPVAAPSAPSANPDPIMLNYVR